MSALTTALRGRTRVERQRLDCVTELRMQLTTAREEETTSMSTKLPAIVLLAMLYAMRASAQELEPRAYSASPIGTNFLLVGIGRSSGGVVFDPTVPITDVHADIDSATLGAGRTFDLGGHLLLATI